MWKFTLAFDPSSQGGAAPSKHIWCKGGLNQGPSASQTDSLPLVLPCSRYYNKRIKGAHVHGTVSCRAVMKLNTATIRHRTNKF